jgi:hypothetical protein
MFRAGDIRALLVFPPGLSPSVIAETAFRQLK